MIVDPLKRWREEVGRQVLNLDFITCGTDPFQASIAPILAEKSVRVVRMQFSPGFTTRDRQLVRDGSDTCVLAVGRTSGIEVEQVRRRTRLLAGDATVLRTTEPGDLGAALSHDYVAILIPASRMTPRVKNMDRFAATRLARTNGALTLLRRYLRTLENTPIASADVRAAATEHVVNLAVLSINEAASLRGLGEAESVHEARLRVALEFIARHFRDPGLSIQMAAEHQDISVRYLQRLLERSGLRFTEHVAELRLAEAHRQLSSSGATARPIIDIAYAAGFSDLSHFNRLFRRRYDATPGALRAQAARSHGHSGTPEGRQADQR